MITGILAAVCIYNSCLQARERGFSTGSEEQTGFGWGQSKGGGGMWECRVIAMLFLAMSFAPLPSRESCALTCMLV